MPLVSSLPSPSKGGNPSSSRKESKNISSFYFAKSLYIWKKKLYEEVKVYNVIIFI
ncbi:hypothetical protein Scep_004668 [Stephania cephalantha]|uniref:Uncharacterized protein n=1 Tax=Stephania cephalantha TaxID=152367 RepID=A0AAP0PXH9_9MAGN